MKFRHKVEKTNINGLREFSVNYYLCDELLIGRGSACHIRLANRLVALTQAKLTLHEDTLFIEDLDTENGTRVNGSIVSRSKLKVGDKVKVGDAEFTVFNDGTYWGFHEHRVEVPEEDRTEVLKRQLALLDLSNYYPRFTTLSLLLSLTIILFFCVDPFLQLGHAPMLWSAGPISNNHKILESNCRACHEAPFKTVRDDSCIACHTMTNHAPTLAKVTAEHPEVNYRCGDCHQEHNGDGALKPQDSRLCLKCHSQLTTLLPKSDRGVVPRFSEHPELAVRIRQYPADPSQPVTLKKVALDSANELIDTTRIKLNHQKHLMPNLRGEDGPTQLTCTDCHQLTADLKKVRPISFLDHCARCHSLGFDDRLKEKVVPHGNPDTVYNYLYAEYAKLFLDTERPGTRQDFVKRYRPGQMPEVEQPNLEFTKAFVEQESRKAEGELFRKTACFLCHEVRELGAQPPGKSGFEVLRPNIPDQWMPAARFSHGAHQQETCDSCHHNVRNSTKTTDLNLPRMRDCTNCHQEGKVLGKVSTECTMCHSFHDSRLLVDSKKRPVRELLAGDLLRSLWQKF